MKPYRPGSRVIVIGNGMAGSRVVQDLRARDPEHRLQITIFAAESHAPYNRIMLSEVLAGRTRADDIQLASPRWWGDENITVHRAVAVSQIDPVRQTIRTADRRLYPYDTLILATGSTPWIPPMKGLVRDDGTLLPGVTPFRTIDDCARIEQFISPGVQAVVIGGGLLGLEAARGLAGRGLAVTVAHPFTHLMERQLDEGAGQVLARTLAKLGVQARLGAGVVEVLGNDAVQGIECADGTTIDASLVILACGVRPDVSLALDADLRVDRGVVVDAQLRSVSHPNVFAIGECAQYDGQVYGLVAPAWEHAEVVADIVSGERPEAAYGGSRVVTRLKAAGIDLASMGDPDGSPDDHDREVIQFADPARGTYKKLVVRDGRLVGAILLGNGATTGAVVQQFTRGAPMPSDPLTLLFGELEGSVRATSPALMPAAAKVCVCNNVTKAQIQESWLKGATSVGDIALATRATTGCGTCRDAVEGICDWLAAATTPPTPTHQETRA